MCLHVLLCLCVSLCVSMWQRQCLSKLHMLWYLVIHHNIYAQIDTRTSQILDTSTQKQNHRNNHKNMYVSQLLWPGLYISSSWCWVGPVVRTVAIWSNPIVAIWSNDLQFFFMPLLFIDNFDLVRNASRVLCLHCPAYWPVLNIHVHL